MPIVDPFAAPSRGIVDPFKGEPQSTSQPEDSAKAPLAWSDVPLEAVKNTPSSAYNTVAGLVGQAASAIKTTAPYIKYGPFGPPKMAFDVGKAIYDDPDLVRRIPAAGLKALGERYGGAEALKRTIATDPVGFGLDVATLYGGGEAALSRLGRGVGEVARAADVSRPFYELPPEPPPPPSAPPPPIPSEMAQTLQRLGDKGTPVIVPRGVTSTSPIVRAGSVALSKVPVVGAPLDEAVRAVPAQIGAGVESVAGQSGPKLPENIVGGGIEQTLSGAARKEAAAGQAETEAANAAAQQKFEREQQAREQAITDRQAQATNAADRAFGNVDPMEMAQDSINDVQSAHRQARTNKDALYDDVNNLDARVHTSAFSDLRPRAEQALREAGVSVDDPGSNAAKMLNELDRLSGKPGELPPGIPPRLMKALQGEFGDHVPASVLEQAGFPGAVDPVPPDFRLAGAHAPAPGASAISVQGLEHLGKRIGRMGMDAQTSEDRNASRIVKGAFDDWRNDVLDSHLTPDSAPNARPVIDAARAAHRDLMDRFGYNYRRLPEGEPRNAAKLLNQIVTGGIGPEGLRDNLIGAKPGNRRVSAPLFEAISNAVPNAADFRNRVRGAYWNRVSAGSPASVANDVAGLTPTRMGSHLFDPREHDLMRGFADLTQQTPRQIAEVRAAKPPKPLKAEPGSAEQLAGRMLGRNRSDEQVLGRFDSAIRQGGDIKEAARVWGKLTPANRDEVRGAWLRNMGGGDEFSLGKFVSNWKDYQDQAKAFMLDRSQRQHLDDFHRVAEEYQDNLKKYGNPSGTAQVTAWHKLLAGTLKTAGAVFTGSMALYHPIGVAIGGLGLRKVSQILARPQGAQQLSRWSRVAQSYRSAPSASKLVALSGLTRSLNAAGE